MSEVPAWVAGYIGLPFAPHGRDRSGLDCWGLCMLVWREQFGRNLPEYEGPAFGETEDAKAIGSVALDFSRHFARIDAGNETEGDGILIRVKGYPLHAALVVAPGWMLHAEMHTDTCLSRYRDFSWERRIHGFYRYIDGRDPPPR